MLLLRRTLLRLSASMKISYRRFFVAFRAMDMAYSSSCSVFGRHASHSTIQRLLIGIYVLEPAMFAHAIVVWGYEWFVSMYALLGVIFIGLFRM